MAERRDVLVVGAGISGLTVAFHLERGGLDVAVVEASDRVGGAMQTLRNGPWTFEEGPNTVLESRPAVARLVREAGLEGEKLTASRTGARRYLWKGDRLRPLPSGPGGFVTTGLFPLRAKLRLLAEPWITPAPEDAEESIAAFVRRRLGQSFLDYAVGPFVSGVYAGDPERLSVRWAVSRVHALERDHGSLIRGALAKGRARSRERARERRRERARSRNEETARRGGEDATGNEPQARGSALGPGGGMISMETGLETLPRRLAEAIGAVETGTPCRAIRRVDGTFRVSAGDREIEARDLVLAVPADAAAHLLDEATGGASRPFAEIPYAPVAVACYGFRRQAVAHPLDGFGFLAPRKESLRVLGCLFPSSLFPGRAPEGHVALSAFAGGRGDPGAVELGDGALHELFLGDLGRALGLSEEPAFRHLVRWPRAIPQYELGHGRYVELARDLERDLPGLHLRSNVLGGVSVPDCIQNATDLA
ncbi:MAG: protoporphyrinogen oxidase, partial [Thermoanaerobaculia bacterium]